MVNAIPRYSGFDAADNFTNFFINHLQDLSIGDIKSVMSVYSANAQCTNRGDIQPISQLSMSILRRIQLGMAERLSKVRADYFCTKRTLRARNNALP